MRLCRPESKIAGDFAGLSSGLDDPSNKQAVENIIDKEEIVTFTGRSGSKHAAGESGKATSVSNVTGPSSSSSATPVATPSKPAAAKSALYVPDAGPLRKHIAHALHGDVGFS